MDLVNGWTLQTTVCTVITVWIILHRESSTARKIIRIWTLWDLNHSLPDTIVSFLLYITQIKSHIYYLSFFSYAFHFIAYHEMICECWSINLGGRNLSIRLLWNMVAGTWREVLRWPLTRIICLFNAVGERQPTSGDPGVQWPKAAGYCIWDEGMPVLIVIGCLRKVLTPQFQPELFKNRFVNGRLWLGYEIGLRRRHETRACHHWLSPKRLKKNCKDFQWDPCMYLARWRVDHQCASLRHEKHVSPGW